MKKVSSYFALLSNVLLLFGPVLVLSLGTVNGGGLENVIPLDQKPLSQIFPPSVEAQANPGEGKFVIFTREPVGSDWDFIAAAWECIPSRPDLAITKRVEFCHSSWNASALLGVLVADGSHAYQLTAKVEHG